MFSNWWTEGKKAEQSLNIRRRWEQEPCLLVIMGRPKCMNQCLGGTQELFVPSDINPDT